MVGEKVLVPRVGDPVYVRGYGVVKGFARIAYIWKETTGGVTLDRPIDPDRASGFPGFTSWNVTDLRRAGRSVRNRKDL